MITYFNSPEEKLKSLLISFSFLKIKKQRKDFYQKSQLEIFAQVNLRLLKYSILKSRLQNFGETRNFQKQNPVSKEETIIFESKIQTIKMLFRHQSRKNGT
jgi:hypothetical protein